MPESIIKVARQQQWRGRQIDLPQPLAPGELGFCVDTHRVFIGGDPSYAPAGINITNQTAATEVFYILENRIIVVTLDSPLSREELQLQLLNDFPNVEDIFVNDDRTIAGFVIPDLLTAQERTDIETNILALNETGAFLEYEVKGLIVDAGDQNEASVLSAAINHASGGATLVNIRLNIELNTYIDNDTYITIQEGNQLYDPLRFVLPPSPSYIDLPNGGLVFGVDESDVWGGEFSARIDDSGDFYFYSGTWTANGNSVTGTGRVAMSGSSQRVPSGLTGMVNFRLDYLAPNSLVLKYKNTFQHNVDFALLLRRFMSVE